MRGYADGGHGQSTAGPSWGPRAPLFDRPKAEPAKRTFAGNVLFAVAFLFVFATSLGGAFGCVYLMLRLGDTTLSSLVHEDGQGGLVAGGIGLGAVTGLFLPVTLFRVVRGTESLPRLGPGEAARNILVLLAFDVYVSAPSSAGSPVTPTRSPRTKASSSRRCSTPAQSWSELTNSSATSRRYSPSARVLTCRTGSAPPATRNCPGSPASPAD